MQKPSPTVMCPATGFAKSCRAIVGEHDCPKYVNVRGVSSSGETIDRWGCVDGFLPLLLVEIAQQTRQAGAATESFRNEVARAETDKRATLLEFARLGAPRTS